MTDFNEQEITTAPAMKGLVINNGIIFGLIAAILGLIPLIFGMTNWALTIGMTLIGFALYIFGGYQSAVGYRNLAGGKIQFGKAFTVAFLTCMVMVAIVAIITLVYNYVNPSAMDDMLNTVRDTYEDGGMSEEQIDAAMDIVSMTTNPITQFISQIFGGAIFAAISGLIAAAIAKRD